MNNPLGCSLDARSRENNDYRLGAIHGDGHFIMGHHLHAILLLGLMIWCMCSFAVLARCLPAMKRCWWRSKEGAQRGQERR